MFKPPSDCRQAIVVAGLVRPWTTEGVCDRRRCQAYVAGAEVVEAYGPIEAIRDPAGLFVVDEDALTTGDAQLGILCPGFTKPNWEQITSREYDAWGRERDVGQLSGEWRAIARSVRLAQ